MSIGGVRKTPDDRLDYDVSLRDWLTDEDTIIEAEAEVSPDESGGLEIESISAYSGEQLVKVWVSGGEAGKAYHVTVTITTDWGRIKEVCFEIRVTELCR